MTTLALAFWVAAASTCAGLLGALTGLGGGLIVVPLLSLVFHVDLRYAVGASLIAVIATSSGATTAYVRNGLINVRLGILLETATTAGALAGAAIAGLIPTAALGVLFGLVLLFTAYQSFLQGDTDAPQRPTNAWSTRLRLDSTYVAPDGSVRSYTVQRVPAGFSIMFFAGILSALLGIGSGVLKVLAMDRLMTLPFKVSTTTSNFMIGVTAAASAGVYLHRGYIDPVIAFPVMLGVLGGAFVGTRVLAYVRIVWLRRLFVTVATIMAVEMLYKGLTGAL